MEDLDSESDLDMTKVMPPSATRNARGASGRTWSRRRGGVRKATPRHYRSPPGGPISVASTEAVAEAATTAAPVLTAATATTAGIFLRRFPHNRGACRFPASSPRCKADARGSSRGA